MVRTTLYFTTTTLTIMSRRLVHVLCAPAAPARAEAEAEAKAEAPHHQCEGGGGSGSGSADHSPFSWGKGIDLEGGKGGEVEKENEEGAGAAVRGRPRDRASSITIREMSGHVSEGGSGGARHVLGRRNSEPLLPFANLAKGNAVQGAGARRGDRIAGGVDGASPRRVASEVGARRKHESARKSQPDTPIR